MIINLNYFKKISAFIFLQFTDSKSFYIAVDSAKFLLKISHLPLCHSRLKYAMPLYRALASINMIYK